MQSDFLLGQNCVLVKHYATTLYDVSVCTLSTIALPMTYAAH